jgi:hypothetical protein
MIKMNVKRLFFKGLIDLSKLKEILSAYRIFFDKRVNFYGALNLVGYE